MQARCKLSSSDFREHTPWLSSLETSKIHIYFCRNWKQFSRLALSKTVSSYTHVIAVETFRDWSKLKRTVHMGKLDEMRFHWSAWKNLRPYPKLPPGKTPPNINWISVTISRNKCKNNPQFPILVPPKSHTGYGNTSSLWATMHLVYLIPPLPMGATPCLTE